MLAVARTSRSQASLSRGSGARNSPSPSGFSSTTLSPRTSHTHPTTPASSCSHGLLTTSPAGSCSATSRTSSLNGKILRVKPDGSPADGNPNPGSPMWSLGHRNVQGLAWDATGRLFATEFGQNTFDEVNLIQPGKNYGWPAVEGTGTNPAFLNPLVTWATSESSPSGDAVSGRSLYLAPLAGRPLWKIPITADGLGKPEAVLNNQFGRLRTVITAPDGSLWVTTSNRDGR